MVDNINKYREAFLSEAKEHLAGMNKALLKLEKKPGKMELVNDIFRETHTLKSMAATMEYNKASLLCHSVEDVLDAVRKKKVKLEESADALFKSFDTLELSLKEIAKGREEIDTAEIVNKLKDIAGRIEAGPRMEARSEESETAEAEGPVEKIQSIEVKVERLDRLMNLAEELLINKMRLDRVKEELKDPELTAAMDTLGRLVSEIQYTIMQARMVPIGFVFNRFPRMVRDLAKNQKKEVNLEMHGADIELDRGVIDEIGDSLVHILRNAVDHGLEIPELRKKAGKPGQGTISLTASRTKGLAVIEVKDDGAGIDIEEVRKTALKKGMVSPGAGKEEVLNSIFFGVSTTNQVTAVSGRGFGLNVAKNKIDTLGGTVKVDSELGKGTTFTIDIPLTLAIIKALFIEASGKPYAIPLVNIERLITVPKDDIKGMLNYEAIVLDEEDIPLTRLEVLFRGEAREQESQPIVIIRKGEEKLGLTVDSFMSTQEIVIKPLNKLVKENRYFAGSTIIGSGEVVLILDVANLMLTKSVNGKG